MHVGGKAIVVVVATICPASPHPCRCALSLSSVSPQSSALLSCIVIIVTAVQCVETSSSSSPPPCWNGVVVVIVVFAVALAMGVVSSSLTLPLVEVPNGWGWPLKLMVVVAARWRLVLKRIAVVVAGDVKMDGSGGRRRGHRADGGGGSG